MDRSAENETNYGQRGVSMDRDVDDAGGSGAGPSRASSLGANARATRDAQQEAPAAEHPFATKSLADAAAAAKAAGKPQEREVVDMLTMKKVKVLVDEHGQCV